MNINSKLPPFGSSEMSEDENTQRKLDKDRTAARKPGPVSNCAILILAVAILTGAAAAKDEAVAPLAEKLPTPLTKEKTTVITDELKRRGKELRVEIEHSLREAKNSDKFKSAGMVDISSVSGKYIPIGAMFEDVEIILQSAGFELLPSPPRPSVSNPPPGYRDAFRFNISGTMILYRDIAVEYSAYAVVIPDMPGAAHAKTKKFTISLHYSSL